METKICSKCGLEKPIEAFAYRDKKRGTRRAECKQCISERQKKKYHDRKNELNEYKKQHSCVKCGESRFYVLDFHHIDPTIKTKDICKLSVESSGKRMWEEIDKCVLLCSNCHREFHYLNEKEGIALEDYLQ